MLESVVRNKKRENKLKIMQQTDTSTYKKIIKNGK